MRYILQMIMMLVCPVALVFAFYGLYEGDSSTFIMGVILTAWSAKEGFWTVWKPSVIKRFLREAKKAGL